MQTDRSFGERSLEDKIMTKSHKKAEPALPQQSETSQQSVAFAAPVTRGLMAHHLTLYLVGGQRFTLDEVTQSAAMPQNVAAFIRAWRQNLDVWHSPGNDPHFGVRVADVSLYEYRVEQIGLKRKA